MWTRLLVLVVGSGLGAFWGMRAHEAALREGAAPLGVAEVPVAAPANLIAEAVLATPDATWRKTQSAVGGVVMLAPPTFGGLVGSFASVLPLGAIIDGTLPAFGAMSGDGRWVIAAHVTTASQARATLVTAGFAPENKTDPIELLHHDEAFVGLAGQYVIVGSDRDAITTLGPYAYRTLPTRTLPVAALAITMTHAALAGRVKTELEARIARGKKFLLDKDEEARREHGGRAPDLADPKPLVDALEPVVSRYVAMLAAMDRADLALDVVSNEDVRVHLTLTPPADGEGKAFVEHLEGGAILPLTTANAAALATIFWRSGEAEREDAANGAAHAITGALGTRVPADDEAKLGDSLLRIAKARVGWAIVSASAGATAGVLLRLPTHKPDAITSAIESDIDLARKPSWAKWEVDAFGVKKIDVAQSIATFTADQGAAQAKWVARDGEVAIALGLDASSILLPPARTLENDEKVSAWLRDLHGDVTWAVIARPLLLDSAHDDAACLALVRRNSTAVLAARATGLILRKVVLSSSKL